MKQQKIPKVHIRKVTIKCIALLLVITAALIGAASATAFIYNTGQKNCVNIRFIAGSDSQSQPLTYPAATVKVAPTYTSALVTFSLFPSASNSPQPATYYTDLLRIQNFGPECTINKIHLSNIFGALNLGNLTIYLYSTQTDNPQTGSPIASTSLTSSSSGTIILLSSPYTLQPYATIYIEVGGYTAPSASAGSKISFTTNIRCSTSAQVTRNNVLGFGSLLMKNSAGTYSGDFGTLALFTFNIKSFDDKVNGEFGLIIRHADSKGRSHIYQVKSSTPITLDVDKETSTADFNLTGTIRDITNPWRPITISSDANIHVSLTDYSRKPDTLAITITAPTGQLYFSSNWVGDTTVEQNFFRGALSISQGVNY